MPQSPSLTQGSCVSSWAREAAFPFLPLSPCPSPTAPPVLWALASQNGFLGFPRFLSVSQSPSPPGPHGILKPVSQGPLFISLFLIYPLGLGLDATSSRKPFLTPIPFSPRAGDALFFFMSPQSPAAPCGCTSWITIPFFTL